MRVSSAIGTSRAFLMMAKPTVFSILAGSARVDCRLREACAKTLNLGAGVLQNRGCRRVRDPEIWAKSKGRSMDDRDALRFKQSRCKLLVIANHLAARRFLADGCSAGRIDKIGRAHV